MLFPVSFETTLNYGGGELFQNLVGLWSLPDSQVGGTSLIGTPGPTLSFYGGMSASRWGTDTIQGRTVNTLRFQRDGRITGSMSGTSIPINDESRTLAGWFKATQTGGSGPSPGEQRDATMRTTSLPGTINCNWINGVKPRASTQSSRMFSSIAGTTSSSLMTAHRTATRPTSTARSYALAPLTAGRARTLALSTSAVTSDHLRISTDTSPRSSSSVAPSLPPRSL